MNAQQHKKGMTLIEVLVGIGIILVVFSGIFGVFSVSLKLIEITKTSTGALALASQQVEYVRSLPYADVGTVLGIPAGLIPQNSTTTLNGTEFGIRTLIRYVDDPSDGLGGADANSITADYKVVKVEVTWLVRGDLQDLSLVSNVVPVGIETLASGGTLTVNVFDALGAPVVNADVRIVNNTTTPAIDVTSFSNIDGTVSFPGAPEASEYEVTVSRPSYSTAKTYDDTVALPNPNPAHLSVIDGDTTTTSFSIDVLSTKSINTYEPIATTTYTETFFNSAFIASSSGNVAVVADELQLLDLGGGIYSLATGTVYMDPVQPLYLSRWGEVTFAVTNPALTSTTFHMYYDNGGADAAIIPDGDLPGNSAGFTSSPIDLSALPIGTYNNIVVSIRHKTNDPSVTPAVQEYSLDYADGPTPLPNIDFTMTGTKTIGTDISADPVFKVAFSTSTNSLGNFSTTTLEWDTYTITVDDGTIGYDIASICEPQPMSISPNTVVSTDLIMVPDTPHTLLVSVRDNNGTLRSGASVRLSRTAGIDETEITNDCGQAFFDSVPEGTVGGGDAYDVEVSLAGFTTDNQNDIEVTGVSNHNVVLFP